MYTKWCAQTFPPIFWIFAIFDRYFTKTVAPTSDRNENYVVQLKEQSLLKKRCKLHRNRTINGNTMPVRTMHPLNARCCGLGAWQTKKKTPHFHTYSWRTLYDLPQTLHGDRARCAHQKSSYPFFDPTYSFSYRVYGKIWPNLPTCGFSAITP